MEASDLKKRTRRFSLNVISFTEKLPRSRTIDVIARQLLRSATSVGANYRAACRAKSVADFVAKMGTVEEEADETIYWLELLMESGAARNGGLQPLLDEANQLVAIAVSSIRTARKRLKAPKPSRS